MAKFLVNNNAQSTLAGAISNSATTINIAPGTGVLFPAPGANEYVVLTLTDAATGLLNEIIHCTNITGDTLTVVRAQEGTTGQTWAANDPIANLCTAGQMENLLQLGEAQSQVTNYAEDTGSPNAYACTLDPPLTVNVPGMPIRILIANTNTTASTLNAGPGASAIVRWDGSALIGGELRQDTIAELEWNGTEYQMMRPAPASAAAAIAGTDTGSYMTPAQVAAAVGGPVMNIQVFEAAGAFTYTPTAGMVYCTVEAIGGGGGGGGIDGDGVVESIAAGGGGAGGRSFVTLTAADIGASEAGVVGALGAGGSAGANAGATGGDSYLGPVGSALCKAKGGVGGDGADSTSLFGAGGLGGGLSGAVGDVKGTGEPGGNGNGGAAVVGGPSGQGGSTSWGGGGRSKSLITGSVAGEAGTGYGSGGSGAANSVDATNAAGGDGTPGAVIITEYILS